jgi:hypothetical protein
MKHDIDMNYNNLIFKLDILYSNMHKYKVNRMENHYIQYFDNVFNIGYNWHTPKLLDGLNYKPKGEDNERRSSGTFLSL